VTFAATRKEEITISPLIAEVLTLIWCLQRVRLQDFHNLIIETDAKTVTRCLGGQVKHADINSGL
jgi:ribonuclease HI